MQPLLRTLILCLLFTFNTSTLFGQVNWLKGMDAIKVLVIFNDKPVNDPYFQPYLEGRLRSVGIKVGGEAKASLKLEVNQLKLDNGPGISFQNWYVYSISMFFSLEFPVKVEGGGSTTSHATVWRVGPSFGEVGGLTKDSVFKGYISDLMDIFIADWKKGNGR